MLILTFTFFIVEIGIGLNNNCLSIAASSLSHFVHLCVGFASFRYTKKAKRTQKDLSFGFGRAEAVGAHINIILLLAACFAITIEAVKRILTPDIVKHPYIVLLTSCLASVVNIIGIIFQQHRNKECDKKSHEECLSDHSLDTTPCQSFVKVSDVHKNAPCKESVSRSENHPISVYTKTIGQSSHPKSKDSRDSVVSLPLHSSSQQVSISPNLEFKLEENRHPKGGRKGISLDINNAAFLHIIAGVFLSCFVVISAASILYLENLERKWVCYIDPSLTIVMVLIIVATSVPLLHRSTSISLQGACTADLHLTDLEGKLLRNLEDIISVHEFHVWKLTGENLVASVHLECRKGVNYMKLSRQVKDMFHDEGIHSTTIQLEVPDMLHHFNGDLRDTRAVFGTKKIPKNPTRKDHLETLKSISMSTSV